MKRKIISIFFSALIFIISSYPLQAGNLIFFNGGAYETSGEYSVSKDEKGVCLRADNGAFWYLKGDDLRTFKPGDTGKYYYAKDAERPFIITDRKKGFYIEQKPGDDTKQVERTANYYYEPIAVTKGGDQLYNSAYGGLYRTKEEALKGIKGQATLDWEREKAEEEIRKQEELEARKKAEEEYRRQHLLEEAVREAAAAKEAAEETRQELERLRKDSRSDGYIIIGNDPGARQDIPGYIPPRNKERKRSKIESNLDRY
jgi:hypothetical protein